MNVDYINPFLSAAVKVLQTTANISPRPGKPHLKNSREACGDISGIIGLTGEKSGSMAVSFSKDCLLKVTFNMLGEGGNDLTGRMADAVGEVTNMIAGDARAALSEKGHSFSVSIPSVVMGEAHTIKHICSGPTIVMPFETEAGPFFIETCFEP